MRNIACMFVLLAAVVGCAEVPRHPIFAIPLESVVSEVAQQFSACNLDALMENYSPTVEFVSPSTPKPIVGRPMLKDHFSGACQAQVRPVMLVEAQRVQLLSSESAVVTGTYSFGRTDRPTDKPWSASFVITLKQSGARWLIITQATFPIPQS